MSQSMPWIAQEAGIFQKYNLDHQLVFIAASSMVTAAILSGDAEMTLTGGVGNVRAYVQGATDLVFIGGVKNVMTQSIVAGGNIKKPEDIKGKQVGVSRIGSNTHYFTIQALRRAGMEPGRDFNFLQTGGDPESLAALLTKKIQVATLTAPSDAKALAEGYHYVVYGPDLKIPYAATAFVSKRSTLAKRPQVMGRFMRAMAEAARDAGLEYIAITDHSQSLAMANGLDERRTLEHARQIRALRDRVEGITVLAGIECDIRPDGSMDLADDCLAELDIVIASVHSAFNQDEAQMTDRLLRAIACPWVDVLAHPTGRLILKRDGYKYDFDRVAAAAAAAGVAVEINSQIDRLDLDEHLARRARDRGCKLIIDSDAHSPAALGNTRWGVTTARRAWLTADEVLNTQPLDVFTRSLRRHRTREAR